MTRTFLLLYNTKAANPTIPAPTGIKTEVHPLEPTPNPPKLAAPFPLAVAVAVFDPPLLAEASPVSDAVPVAAAEEASSVEVPLASADSSDV